MRWDVVYETVPGAKFQPGELVSFGVWEHPASGLSISEIMDSRVDLTAVMPFVVRHTGTVMGVAKEFHGTSGQIEFHYTIQAVETGKTYYFMEEELMRA